MRLFAHPPADRPAGSRIERLALRIAERHSTRITAPARGDSGETRLSRRKLLTRTVGAGAVVMLPLRLVNPTEAHAEGYCAAQCLDDANAAHDARLTKCLVSAFGTDIPDAKAFAAYVSAKIKSGGLGALVLAQEIASADLCGVITEVRYYRDAAKCGEPNCGDPKRYPPHAQGACQGCTAGHHCCVCRDYNDGKPLPNVLVNGGYSCTTYCTQLGFTVISDTAC
jgi:hypothetical protein